ncbi:glycosyltransferase family 4 protein [bacterium]|nr:glycosyltransferase family 4 protein [bacterium]
MPQSDSAFVYTIIGFILVAGWSSWLTGWIRSIALKRGVMDVPNERSSHKQPVPRGGGLAIVVTSMVGVGVLAVFRPGASQWLLNILISGGLIVAIGLLDDLFQLKKRIRITIHILAAVVIVLYVGRNLEIIFPRALEVTGPVAITFVMLYVIWNINSYNFMDGIDGLAGGQAVFMGVTAGSIATFNGNPTLGMVYYLMAASSLGFLRWNWQPAKIFMGDMGSTFIGVTLAVLGIWGKVTSTVPLTAFLILMAVFYTDTTYTVIRKVFERDNPTKTHRDFAFHHAIRKGYSHAKVTGGIMLINFSWLLPLAVLAVLLRSNWSIVPLALAYLPLLYSAVYLKAGQRLNDGQDPEYLAKKMGRKHSGR